MFESRRIEAAPAPAAPRRPPLMRRVEVAVLAEGGVVEMTRLVPALPAFEEAFAALARGTVLHTDRGLVAVEDVRPGLAVRTAEGRFARVLWRGALTVVPGAPGQDPAMGRLTRVAADALGIARPIHDLVLGPHARLLRRGQGVRASGVDAAFVPAADLVDGVNVVSIAPAAPVEAFHIGLDRHAAFLANGVEVEAQHPGRLADFPLRGELLDLWLQCFPHRAGLLSFGPAAWPRVSPRDEGLEVA